MSLFFLGLLTYVSQWRGKLQLSVFPKIEHLQLQVSILSLLPYKETNF